MLPDLDGLAVARRLRDRRVPVPVIFLSAKDATEDKIAGLALGDDYVTKPFSLAELVARVQTVLRRTQGDDGHVLRFADVELDDDTRQVRRGDAPLDLTPTEFRLLRFLLQNPRRVLSKRQILDNVWNYDFGGDANVVETYVSYLRRKLDSARAAADPHGSAGRLRAARTGSVVTCGGRSGGRIGAALRGMSLRARLLLVLAVLSAAGLLAADVATYTALRSSLFQRVDTSLDTSATGVSSSLAAEGSARARPGLAAAAHPVPRAVRGAHAGHVRRDPAAATARRRCRARSPARARPPRARASRRASRPASDGSPRRATVSAHGEGTQFPPARAVHAVPPMRR